MSGAITYLDNNASTRVDDAVLAAMQPYFAELYGNPSSLHHFGAQVFARIEAVRSVVARLIGARDGEIVFTSGGTEADNAALRGVLAARPDRRHAVISAVEHSAILEPAEQLRAEGFEITHLSVRSDGRVDLEELRSVLRADTALVSVMLANNETGVIMPVREVVELARGVGALVHTDAVNALGKMSVNVEELGVALMSLSAHKIYGPKGVGALYIRRGTPWRPLLYGGRQERERRGGTYNAPGIIGLGAACELLLRGAEQERGRIAALRDRLEAGLRSRFPDCLIVGAAAPRVPNTCCVCFPGVESEAVLLLLSELGICASSGSACSSGSLEPSHVLRAMGVDPHVAQGQIRFSLGRFSTSADIDRLLEVLPGVIERVAAVNIA